MGVDRKTVRRYLGAATESGQGRDASEGDMDEAFVAKLCERARPRRPNGHGGSWSLLEANHDRCLNGWLTKA